MTGRRPYRTDKKLEWLPCPDLNGKQMACVEARFALEKAPAIAHFAAVHHHVEETLRTVAVNDRREWIPGNVARVRAELNLLEQAVEVGMPSLDLTERHRSTYNRPPFVGIDSGLRQPLDSSKGWRDHSVAYRPGKPRLHALGGPGGPPVRPLLRSHELTQCEVKLGASTSTSTVTT
ncbi:hypothetical protein ABZV92_19425 [Streptomyces rubiginosohelvolus]|uniref:hypothetical protein n=1 Tax=Streptomyces rubiginosohelvolus TaxID=67362 RepID=UPI0033B4FB18